MRITDRSPTGRRLQTIFFPAEPRPVMPTEVSDEIVLVHPAAPPMVGLKEGKFFHSSTTAAVGVTTVVGPLVPTDEYWWVQFCQVQHNDATGRVLWLSVRDTVPNDAAFHTPNISFATGVPLAAPRAINLPNDMRLIGTASNLAGGSALTLSFFYLKLLHAEVNPTA